MRSSPPAPVVVGVLFTVAFVVVNLTPLRDVLAPEPTMPVPMPAGEEVVYPGLSPSEKVVMGVGWATIIVASYVAFYAMAALVVGPWEKWRRRRLDGYRVVSLE